MQVQKYRDGSGSQANLLEIGDIFRGDSSLTVTDIAEEDTLLTINQDIDTHRDTGKRSINFKASTCHPVRYSDRNATLDEILRVKEISVKDKFLVVVNTNMQGGGPAPHGESVPFPDGHHVDAVESNKYGEPVENGLKLVFYQTGSFNCMIPFPHYVGHNRDIAKATEGKLEVS